MNLPEGYKLEYEYESHSAFLYAGKEKIAEFPLDDSRVIGKIEEIINVIEKVAWQHYYEE